MSRRDELVAELTASLKEALLATARGCGLTLAPQAAEAAAGSVLADKGLPDAVAQRFGDRPACALVAFDADSIQSWVFASERVQVAGGASQTLKEINERARRIVEDKEKDATIPLPEVICGTAFSAGGGGMWLASAGGDLADLERRLCAWLEVASLGLTFTVKAVELRSADLRPSGSPLPLSCLGGRFDKVDGLRGTLVRLQVLLRDAKDSRPRLKPIATLKADAGKTLERCRSCQRCVDFVVPSDEPKHWCAECKARRALFRERNPDLYERGEEPITFSDFAEAVARQRSYLGFIAIDGNAMGSLVQEMGSLVELRAFSEKVSDIFHQARATVNKTLEPFLAEEWLERYGGRAESAYLSLLSGGDEITLVLPAAAAPRVAIEVLRELERGFDAAGLTEVGAAAGVILAAPTYPVRLLRRYAAELQKAAKKECAAPDGPRFAVAWTLLTDSSPLPEWPSPPRPSSPSLPSFPRERREEEKSDLSLECFERLLGEVQSAIDVQLPRSALQRLLAYHRQEESRLCTISHHAGKEQVLAVLDANFFRYQLARNERLAKWWEKVGPKVEPDPVAHWFAQGGSDKLQQIVDLLSLEPFCSSSPSSPGWALRGGSGEEGRGGEGRGGGEA